MGAFNVKPIINKKNGQINISLPKKKIPVELRNSINIKNIKLKIMEWDLW
jgi:hypothetical protein